MTRLPPVARRLIGERKIRMVKRWGLSPPMGKVDFGDFRRMEPVSAIYGYDRGTPVDRWFIERFLQENARFIRGAVVEVSESLYADRFGEPDSITSVDILDNDPTNPLATVVGDLGNPAELPLERFDCVICTQTLFLVADMAAGVRSLHAMLRPGGTLLLSVPVVSQLCMEPADHWRVTSHGARHLLGSVFTQRDLRVEAHGNLLTCIAFLHGIAAEELEPQELRRRDPNFELVVTARATRG